MRDIILVNFTSSLAEDLTGLSAHLGFKIRRHEAADQIPGDAAAVFVCGDHAGWLETICHIRSTHSRMFLVVVTRLPDHEKWLDALEAGANDYCCAPLDPRQFAWLLRKDCEPQTAATPAAAWHHDGRDASAAFE